MNRTSKLSRSVQEISRDCDSKSFAAINNFTDNAQDHNRPNMLHTHNKTLYVSHNLAERLLSVKAYWTYHSYLYAIIYTNTFFRVDAVIGEFHFNRRSLQPIWTSSDCVDQRLHIDNLDLIFQRMAIAKSAIKSSMCRSTNLPQSNKPKLSAALSWKMYARIIPNYPYHWYRII